MRLTYPAVASLTLHTLLVLLISNGTYRLEEGVSRHGLESGSTAGQLSVTLKSPHLQGDLLPLQVDEPSETKPLPPSEDSLLLKAPSSTEYSDENRIQALTDNQPHYYFREEVDRPPRMMDNFMENDGALDKALRDLDDHGLVIFELWINERGWIEKITIISSSLPESVVSMIRNQLDLVRFVPARLNGKVVHCRIRIEVQVREKARIRGDTSEG